MSENPFTDGQQFSAARLNSMYNAHQNEGVLNGLDASTSVNAFDVDVASGELFLNDDVVSVGSATLSLSTSDPEDRIDLISADSTGLTVTQGNPAATSGQPIAPDIPSGDVLVSLIYVRGGSTEILTGDIFNDYRVELQSISPALIDQSLPGDLDESFFDHSGLANIQRNDHHTPVVFEYNPHGRYFQDTGSVGTPSSIDTGSNNAAFCNQVTAIVSATARSSSVEDPELSGTITEVEVFDSKAGNYVTVGTPNTSFFAIDGSTDTVSPTFNISPTFCTRLRVSISYDEFASDGSMSLRGSADVRAPVFE